VEPPIAGGIKAWGRPARRIFFLFIRRVAGTGSCPASGLDCRHDGCGEQARGDPKFQSCYSAAIKYFLTAAVSSTEIRRGYRFA